MDDFNGIYEDALFQVETSIEESLNRFFIPVNSFSIENNNSFNSTLDAWDYCYSIAIGLAGVFISTNESFARYLEDIHKAASGASGDYDLFQTFLGKTLKHKGDFIDSLNGTFKNRSGENAYPLFHRLLWGHDIFSLESDNPFLLMFKQKGLSGLLQAAQHLLADTASKQGLPLPGSSFFDFVDSSGNKTKTSNYLINISQKLSQDAFGNKAKAQEIYSHIATIRAQDVTAGFVVKSVSELYFKIRKIDSELRKAEMFVISYVVNFVGEAIIGSLRQNGIPYINVPLAVAAGSSFAKFCYIDSKEISQLTKATSAISQQIQGTISDRQNSPVKLEFYDNATDIINAYEKSEENVDDILSFFSEVENE